MLKLILLSLFTFTSVTWAQSHVLLKPSGEVINLKNNKTLQEAIKVSKVKNFKGVESKSVFTNTNRVANGGNDTINYRRTGGSWNTDFGFFSQDVMMVWFQAHADMTIKGIGYTCSDETGSNNATVNLRLIKLNWIVDELKSFSTDTFQGYYPFSGNDDDPFGEGVTVPWVTLDSNHILPPWTNSADPSENTWDYDLWSNDGFGWPTTAVASPYEAPVYNWLMLDDTGLGETDIASGEVFAIVAMHNGTTLNEDRIGFWADNELGIPSWKYYKYGRTSPDVDSGWWVRMYTWDFAVVADVYPRPYPWIYDVTILETTLSTEERVVEAKIDDVVPGDSSTNITMNLVYTINDGEEIKTQMLKNGDVYVGTIPGQQPGTVVTYTIEATDIDGFYGRWPRTVTYRIFEPEKTNALLVFNGYDRVTGYPQSYYFGVGDYIEYSVLEWDHDTWAYGVLTEELINNYSNIIEITTAGPRHDNSQVIKAWLDADAARNYMLAGDEWLGGIGYGWEDSVSIPEGDFARDVLGVKKYYPDIQEDPSLPTEVYAVEGSLLGADLFSLHQKISNDSGWTSPITYDPTYEVGRDNWLDGLDFTDDVEVDLIANDREDSQHGIVGHRIYGEGNKIVFLAYDPLSIHIRDTSFGHYYWYGFEDEAPQVKALDWFEAIVVDVVEKKTVPGTYQLSQNYPNPFNPSTTIEYSILVSSIQHPVSVSIKVYDVLGREVATLVNKEQKPGNYKVQFNTSKLTSGVYFYRLQCGDFVESKKMILLK